MNIKIKSIKHNAIMNSLLSVVNIIFPLITFPYVSRVLGVSANGRLSFASSVVSYFTLFATLGMTTYGIRACAKSRDDKKELSKNVHEILMIGFITAIIMFLILIFFVAKIPKLNVEAKLIGINSVTLLLNVAGMNWLYSGIEQYDYITIRSIMFKLISIVLMFLFVHSPEDIYRYALITVFALAGPNVLNIIYSRNYVEYRWIGGYNLKRHLKPTLMLFATLLAVNIYTNLDNVMLGFMTDNFEVGIYHASVRIKTVLITMVTSLGAVLLPRLSNYLKNNKSEEFYKALKKSFDFTCFAGISMAIYFFVFAKEGILFLSGKEYLEAVLPMKILIGLVALTGFSNIIGMQIFIPSNRENKFMIAVICGAVVDLGLNIFAIPLFGAVGAAISTLIAEIVQFLIQVMYARKEIGKFADFKTFFIVTVSATIAILLVLPIKLYIELNSFMMILTTGVLYYFIYCVILLFFKFGFLYELIYQLEKRKIKK